MKHLKHLFTALLLLCTTAATAHDFEVDGIYYNVTDATNKTVEVTYKGVYNQYSNEYTGSVVIPESVIYDGSTYSVTRIGYEAFYGCKGLTSITIPNSVTSIQIAAFYGCTSIKELHIEDGESALSLGYNGSEKGLFNDCPLETLYLGRDLSYNISSSYRYSPFYNKSTLTSVTIGNSVTSIGEYVFYGCKGL
ncbi:MAG: leucine-rich repeat domain-containing protein, partial [Bacteroidaceae bacterium]|nr:leucine-rich repeat domain-containing protein [Bacteroidaceae bacterium]